MSAFRRLHVSARTLGAATFVVLGVLFVGFTVVIDHGLRGARLDLTENRLYTLADGTKRLIAGLKEPIDLYFYFSRGPAREAPYLGVYATRVRELLEEIAARSDGKVRLHVVDPAPYSDDEDRASGFGLKAVPLGLGRDPVYFGLAATNSTDGHAVIEFFQPQKEDFLEYDVARLIHALAEPRKRVVGLLSTLPLTGGFDAERGGMRPAWAIDERLRELYEVRAIAPTATALPDGLDALMIVQPKGLSGPLKHAIDRYVVGGGRVLLFVDPDSQQDESAQQPAAAVAGGDRTSSFEPFLAAWGVKFDPTRALGDLGHALLVGGENGEPVRHLAFAGLGEDAFTPGEPLTAALDVINVGTPGFIVQTPVPRVTFEPLLTSSTQSAPIPVATLEMAATPDSLRAGFRPDGRRYVLAARLVGALPAAFADTAVPAGSRRPASVVVVADTDLLADMLWTRTQAALGQRLVEAWASNGDFVLNAVDQLAGSADLIDVRGRAAFSRPFTRVEALRDRADERLRAKAAELQRELEATERQLATLQERRDDPAAGALTPAQRRELERFEQEKLRIRRELREVRRGLDVEIDRLGATLKVLNVAAVPLLLSIVALVVAAVRRRRRRTQAPA
jgi:ABC-type uncharacterized transport system involved in gliding motility auxiliary subunit